MGERKKLEASLTLESPWEEVSEYLIDTYFQREEVEAFLEDFLSWKEPPNAALRRERSPHPEMEEGLIRIETEGLRKVRQIMRQSEDIYPVLTSFIESEFAQERFARQWERETKNFPQEKVGIVLKEVVKAALGGLIGDAELTLHKRKNKFPDKIRAEVELIWAFSNFLFRYFSKKLPDN